MRRLDSYGMIQLLLAIFFTFATNSRTSPLPVGGLTKLPQDIAHCTNAVIKSAFLEGYKPGSILKCIKARAAGPATPAAPALTQAPPVATKAPGQTTTAAPLSTPPPLSGANFFGGVPFCFPSSLAINALDGLSANGVPLFPTCVALAASSTSSGNGRRLQQAFNTSSAPFPIFYPTTAVLNSTDNTTQATYFIPLSIFSLNANRSASNPASSWAVGPLMSDERVLATITTLLDTCPPEDRGVKTLIQAALWEISNVQNVSASSPLPNFGALGLLPTIANNCSMLGNTSAGAFPGGLPNGFSTPTLYDTIFDSGVGNVTGPVTGTQYQWPEGTGITVISVKARQGPSDCGGSAAVGYGIALDLCVEVQLQTPLSDTSMAMTGRRLLQSQDSCTVEVKLRVFIPTEVVYAPYLPDFGQIGGSAVVVALNGNNRGFSYSQGDSKAELKGTFTISDNFKSIEAVSPGVGFWGKSLQYFNIETLWSIIPPWGGTLLFGKNSLIYKSDQLVRTTSNLHMFGKAISSRQGRLDIHADGGIPLLLFAPKINADISITFLKIPASDGSGFNYKFIATGSHDGFPAYELYINQVLVYSYSPLNSPAGIAAGPLGLFLKGQNINTGPQLIGRCPQAVPTPTCTNPAGCSGVSPSPGNNGGTGTTGSDCARRTGDCTADTTCCQPPFDPQTSCASTLYLLRPRCCCFFLFG